MPVSPSAQSGRDDATLRSISLGQNICQARAPGKAKLGRMAWPARRRIATSRNGTTFASTAKDGTIGRLPAILLRNLVGRSNVGYEKVTYCLRRALAGEQANNSSNGRN